MKGKTLVLSLVVASLAITPSTGTMAYLKDEQTTVASFTTGQVKIHTRTASIPREGNTDAAIIANAEDYLDGYFQANCTSMIGPNATCNKFTYVENVGTVSAYVRVRVLIPNSLISVESPPITLNYTASTEYITVSSNNVPCSSYSSELCKEFKFTRKEPLPPGGLTINPVIDSITYNVISSTQTEGGENDEATSPNLDLSVSNIKVYTEAIQAQGFENASDAFVHYNN